MKIKLPDGRVLNCNVTNDMDGNTIAFFYDEEAGSGVEQPCSMRVTMVDDSTCEPEEEL